MGGGVKYFVPDREFIVMKRVRGGLGGVERARARSSGRRAQTTTKGPDYGAAKESNLPTAGLRRPAGFEGTRFALRLGGFAGSSRD